MFLGLTTQSWFTLLAGYLLGSFIVYLGFKLGNKEKIAKR